MIGIRNPRAHMADPKMAMTAQSAATVLRSGITGGPLHRGVQVILGNEEGSALTGCSVRPESPCVDPFHDGPGAGAVAHVLRGLLGRHGLAIFSHHAPYGVSLDDTPPSESWSSLR